MRTGNRYVIRIWADLKIGKSLDRSVSQANLRPGNKLNNSAENGNESSSESLMMYSVKTLTLRFYALFQQTKRRIFHMKAKFRTLYKLMIVLMVCGLTLFTCSGCGNDESMSIDEADGGNSRNSSGAEFGSFLNPPNAAAFDDVFFKNYGVNPFIDTEDDHFSTFGMDVDTASYSVMRRYIRDGHLPPPEAVRVEEFVNALDYNYAPPSDGAFAVHIEGAPSRFGEGKRLQLLRIGIKGRVVSDENRKDAILTFVIDVSGSMSIENRLGLVKRALTLLVEQLRSGDEVGIVVYGSRARVVLPHTGIEAREEILAAINSLEPEGSTNAEEGLRVGYDLALRNARLGSINRVILCSDGVANVGQTGADDILREIRAHVDEGITLTTVGFGMGNFNDVLMEQLADDGNGVYAYVDTLNEAKRIFVENLTGTLQVIAKDAKVQVDFNPQVVSRFRLLGYENRRLAHEDFRDDSADGGEIGSGHSVTALYEIKLHESATGKLATIFIRYEDPDSHRVTEISEDIFSAELEGAFEDMSPEFQLAATVAEFAEILRESFWAQEGSLEAVHQVIESISPQFRNERVGELSDLVSQAAHFKARNGE